MEYNKNFEAYGIVRCIYIVKKIIINADDFGLNQSCTKAICEAFNRKLITDTTLVANGEAFDYAVKEIEGMSLDGKVGIHINLTEGAPLTEGIKECSEFVTNGVFHGKVLRFKPLKKSTRRKVYAEMVAQVEKIQKAGITISHADSHHHIHTSIFIAPIFIKVCKEKGIEKIRIHRNVGNIYLYKRIGKYFYNLWLKLMRFKSVRYFGTMDDIEKVGVFDDMEIMVHPEYNVNKVLIDKVEEEKGYPIGKPIRVPKGNILLRGYKDI